MLTNSLSRQASREPGAPTLPATTSHNDISVAIMSRKITRRRRTRVVERLLAVEIPVPQSRGLDRPSRRASQVRDLSDTRGSTQRFLAVEIPVPQSNRMDRPSCRALIPVPESKTADRSSCEALVPVPESKRADRSSRGAFIQVPESRTANRPSRRAFKLGDPLELSESTRQEIPVPPISGGPSMAETNLSASSRPESNSGSLTRRIIARLWGILSFRRPRTLDHRRLLRRLRSSRWDLGRLFRFNRLTTTAQAAPGTNFGHVAVRSVGTQAYLADHIPKWETIFSSGNAQALPWTNVGHVAVRSVGTQTYLVDDIPRRETVLSSENAQAAPGTNVGQVAVISVETQTSPVDDIPRRETALSSENAQAAPGTNVSHVAVRSVESQTSPIDDIPRRETVLSSENVQAVPGMIVNHVAVRSVETQTSRVDDIPRPETAVSSENIRSSASGQLGQFSMRKAARRTQVALAKDDAAKIDNPQTQEEPRPQPVLKSILKKRGPPPPSEPLYGDPHRARTDTGMLFRDYEDGSVLRSARILEGKLRRTAAAMHRDKSKEVQSPAIRILNLTGKFRVPSPTSSEDSKLSDVTCGAGLRSSQAGLEATTSNDELSLAGFELWQAGLQTTVADFGQEIGKSSAAAVEVPQMERQRGLLVETQENAQPFNDSTHNEAGNNFEQMDCEPDVEPTVVDDLHFRSADEHLAGASPIVRAQVNPMWTEADRQVAAEDFAGPTTSIPILSGPNTKGDEQDADAMDTAPDIVANKAVVNRVPVNSADEYLATVSPRVRAYLNSIWTEEDRRVAVEDFAREMEFRQGQAAEPPPIVAGSTDNNVVDVGQEANVADSRASTMVRASMDAYLTTIPPGIRAHVDSMWTEQAEQAAIAGFAREFAIFQACEDLCERMRE